jgi:hypothetical protein
VNTRSTITGENLLQKNVCYILSIANLPHFAIPNGSDKKSHAARYVFKVTGLKAGVPDLCIPRAFTLNGQLYHGMFMELKNGKKGKLSPFQAEWIELLRKEGYYVALVRDLMQAENILRVAYPEQMRKIKF